MRPALRASLGSLFVWLALSAAAQVSPGTEVILLLDATESMERTDPDHGRHAAAWLFANLLSDENSLGVIEFSDHPHAIAPLLPLNSPLNRTNVQESLTALGSDGVHTDMSAALERALEIFDLDVPRSRSLILVADGALDLAEGSAAEASALTSLRTQTIVDCIRHGIPIHTIALGEDADATLLSDLSASTGGEHRAVSGSQDLCRALVDLLAVIDATQAIPLEDGVAQVDDSVQRVAFMHIGEGSSVTDPKGNLLHANEQGLVMVDRPSSGAWTITASTGQERVAAVSDLRLDVTRLPSRVRVGEPLSVQARLSDASLAPEVDLVVQVDGEVVDDPDAVTFAEGRHKLTVTAHGDGLARERHLVIEAMTRTVIAEVSPRTVTLAEGVVIEARIDGESLAGEANASALLSLPDGTEQVLDLLPTDADHFATMFDPADVTGLHSVRVQVTVLNDEGLSRVVNAAPVFFEVEAEQISEAQLPPLTAQEPVAQQRPVTATVATPEQESEETDASSQAEPTEGMPSWLIYLIAAVVALVSGGVTLFLALRGDGQKFPSLAEIEAEKMEKPEVHPEESATADAEVSKPAADPEPEPEPESDPESDPEPEPEPKAESEPDPEPEPEVAAESETIEEEIVEEAPEDLATAEISEAEPQEEEPHEAEPPEAKPEETAAEDLVLTPDEMESIFGEALGDDVAPEDEKSQIDFGDEDLVMTHDELNDLFEQATADPLEPPKAPESD